MRHFSAAVLVAVVLLANVERAISKLITGYPIVNHDPVGYQNGVTPKRLLRRFDEETEERAIGGSAISRLTFKIKRGMSKFTEKVKNLNKYDNQLVAEFKLADSNIDKLKKVTEQVEKANAKNIFKKVTVVGTLTAGYGDDVLAKAIATIEQKAILEGNSILKQQMRALRQDQLVRWKDGGNSADDVFKLLKAENVRDDSRMFLVLDDYVKLVSRKKSV
ncbi:RxLR effector protein [Phytophthora megakarya]|uniref:RxLR effector protein n=1 Tax=Phytophthora megakarya TaxID=4795 RepID=A0A225UJK3_9STRA|nr:RxLR effector protein [Phytophthora megakarya]